MVGGDADVFTRAEPIIACYARAVALMGGLLVATALTLLFLPALYAAWFRVKRPDAKAALHPVRHGAELALAAE